MKEKHSLKSVFSDPYCVNILNEMERRRWNNTEPPYGYSAADLIRMAGRARVKYGEKREERELNHNKIGPRIDKLRSSKIIIRRKRGKRWRYFFNPALASGGGVMKFFEGYTVSRFDSNILSEYDPIDVRNCTVDGMSSVSERELDAFSAEIEEEDSSSRRRTEVVSYRQMKACRSSPIPAIRLMQPTTWWFLSEDEKEAEHIISVYGVRRVREDVEQTPNIDHDAFVSSVECQERILRNQVFEEIEELLLSLAESLRTLCPDGWSIVIHSKRNHLMDKLKSTVEKIREPYPLPQFFYGKSRKKDRDAEDVRPTQDGTRLMEER